MKDQWAHAPATEIQSFVQSAFSTANFLKYFMGETWRGGGESLLENGTVDDYAY